MYEAILEDVELRCDYYTKLVIRHNGKALEEYYDQGEPEDNNFYRDWSWVPKELERAYKLGGQDSAVDIEKLLLWALSQPRELHNGKYTVTDEEQAKLLTAKWAKLS